MALQTYLQPLAPFLSDDDLTEIVINQPGEVWIEGRSGWRRNVVPELNFEYLLTLAKLVGSGTKQDITQKKPVLSSTLPTGERIQVVIPPAVTEGTVSITIRKPSKLSLSLEELAEANLFEDVMIAGDTASDTDTQLMELYQAKIWPEFLTLGVLARKNILISGATGSGKTTLSKALIRKVPDTERLITIEDTKELEIPQPNHVRLYYSKDNQGLSEAGPKELLESCLRMRPDRIFLQELRDGTAFFYLRNVNSGHPGSITTVHADSASLAFEQLTLLVKESEGGSDLDRDDIRALLYQLVDIVIQIKRFDNGQRRVTEVFFDPSLKGSALR